MDQVADTVDMQFEEAMHTDMLMGGNKSVQWPLRYKVRLKEGEWKQFSTIYKDENWLSLAQPGGVMPPFNETVLPIVISLERKVKGLKGNTGEKVVPDDLSFKLPKNYHDLAGLTKVQKPPKSPGPNSIKNEAAGETTISRSKILNFKLPDDIHQSILMLEEKLPRNNIALAERLEGWTIRRVARNGGRRIDKDFYHGRKNFRSFLEVQTYIVYGDSNSTKKGKHSDEESAAAD